MKTSKFFFITILVLSNVLLYVFFLNQVAESLSFTRDRLFVYTSTPYKVFSSPDNQFKLELYSYCPLSSYPLIFKFHINADDYPGVVILRDRTGAILNSCVVERKSYVNYVDWTPNNVHVTLVLNWKLTPPP
jgi:hypothetical protein